MGKSDALKAVIRGAACAAGSSSDFDLNPSFQPPTGYHLRPAAVLLPFVDRADGLRLILTKRAAHLRHHPGQIAFPGGKVDPDDSGPKAAALREAEEEIGLTRDKVEVLASLPHHETVTGFSILPVLGMITQDFQPKPEAGEVDEVFSVPFSFLANPENYQITSRFWRGERRYFYTIPYGPYYIWGATARILRALAEGIKL
ncbi:MAG: CoA pyrophosphatase [Rhodobacteraceae bacterium]|nr:CoA pyrophosphatase [Paracoccaceae bacterium]